MSIALAKFAASKKSRHKLFNNDKHMSKTIPGLSFSWKRALGVTKVKREFAKATGIPTTRGGIERKIGRVVLNAVFGKRK